MSKSTGGGIGIGTIALWGVLLYFLLSGDDDSDKKKDTESNHNKKPPITETVSNKIQDGAKKIDEKIKIINKKFSEITEKDIDKNIKRD